MKTDLLQPLEVLTHLAVKLVREELAVLSVDDVLEADAGSAAALDRRRWDWRAGVPSAC